MGSINQRSILMTASTLAYDISRPAPYTQDENEHGIVLGIMSFVLGAVAFLAMMQPVLFMPFDLTKGGLYGLYAFGLIGSLTICYLAATKLSVPFIDTVSLLLMAVSAVGSIVAIALPADSEIYMTYLGYMPRLLIAGFALIATVGFYVTWRLAIERQGMRPRVYQ